MNSPLKTGDICIAKHSSIPTGIAVRRVAKRLKSKSGKRAIVLSGEGYRVPESSVELWPWVPQAGELVEVRSPGLRLHGKRLKILRLTDDRGCPMVAVLNGRSTIKLSLQEVLPVSSREKYGILLSLLSPNATDQAA